MSSYAGIGSVRLCLAILFLPGCALFFDPLDDIGQELAFPVSRIAVARSSGTTTRATLSAADLEQIPTGAILADIAFRALSQAVTNGTTDSGPDLTPAASLKAELIAQDSEYADGDWQSDKDLGWLAIYLEVELTLDLGATTLARARGGGWGITSLDHKVERPRPYNGDLGVEIATKTAAARSVAAALVTLAANPTVQRIAVHQRALGTEPTHLDAWMDRLLRPLVPESGEHIVTVWSFSGHDPSAVGPRLSTIARQRLSMMKGIVAVDSRVTESAIRESSLSPSLPSKALSEFSRLTSCQFLILMSEETKDDAVEVSLRLIDCDTGQVERTAKEILVRDDRLDIFQGYGFGEWLRNHRTSEAASDADRTGRWQTHVPWQRQCSLRGFDRLQCPTPMIVSVECLVPGQRCGTLLASSFNVDAVACWAHLRFDRMIAGSPSFDVEPVTQGKGCEPRRMTLDTARSEWRKRAPGGG